LERPITPAFIQSQEARLASPNKWLFLSFLLTLNILNFYDRQVLSAVAEPLRREWHLTDLELGWLQTAFTLLYAVVGIPLGRLADIWSRTRIIAIALFSWSALTSFSGFCLNYWSLFVLRLGVGIGEAGCAPSASSILGDIFKPHERSRAMAVFMAGLPIGLAASLMLSGAIAEHFDWRTAFFVAGLPGLALSCIALIIREPARGQSEETIIGNKRRPGSPILLVLSVPTMWFIIISGALHNFAMYALSSFLPALLVRYHQVTVQTAGFLSGIVIGLIGALGMLLGGVLGDRWFKKQHNGRMMVAFCSILASVPFGLLALKQTQGEQLTFIIFQGAAYLFLYMYYGVVYSSIHDIIEPSLRGTAMGIYFFAMYVLGASIGPVATGWLSDNLARRAAGGATLLQSNSVQSEYFRALGLHQAMYIVPIMGAVIALFLLAGSFTVKKDTENLRGWMRKTAGE
jgi:MFS family permease